MVKKIIKLDQIKEEISKFMILSEDHFDVFELILAASLSLNLSRPVWLMFIAPPSSGKTQLMSLISGVENYYSVSTLTSKYLFSGHPSAKGGFMIREVGPKGILAFPDFTTVLSQSSRTRNEIMNQLRVIHDGHAGLGTGLDFGSVLQWKGKVAVIASVTQSVEKMKEKNTDLGDRFLYYAFSPPDLKNIEDYVDKCTTGPSNSLAEKIGSFVKSKADPLMKYEIDLEETNELLKLATFVSKGRAPVDRDGASREVSFVHTPEQPHRLLKSLLSLYSSLVVITEDKKRSMRIIRKVCLSSIPVKRLDVLNIIQINQSECDLKYILDQMNISNTVGKRVVEDMKHQRIIVEKSVQRKKS